MNRKPFNPDDFDDVLKGVHLNGCDLEFASGRLKNSLEIARAAIVNDPRSFKFVGEDFKTNIDNILFALREHFENYLHVDGSRVKGLKDSQLWGHIEGKSPAEVLRVAADPIIRHRAKNDWKLRVDKELYEILETQLLLSKKKIIMSGHFNEFDPKAIQEERVTMFGLHKKFMNLKSKKIEFVGFAGAGSSGISFICTVKGNKQIFVLKIIKDVFAETVDLYSRDRFLFDSNVAVCLKCWDDKIDVEKIRRKKIKKGSFNIDHLTFDGYDYTLSLMPYYGRNLGDFLFNKISRNPKNPELNVQGRIGLSLPEFLRIMKGILQGAHFLFENRIVHRDIWEENIFVMEDLGRIWIGDFDLILQLDELNNNDPTSFLVDVKENYKELTIASCSGLTPDEMSLPGFIVPPESRGNLDGKLRIDFSKCDSYAVGILALKMMSHTNLDQKLHLSQIETNGSEKDVKMLDSLKGFFLGLAEEKFNDRLGFSCPCKEGECALKIFEGIFEQYFGK